MKHCVLVNKLLFLKTFYPSQMCRWALIGAVSVIELDDKLIITVRPAV